MKPTSLQTTFAKLEWSADGLPRSAKFNDIYFSSTDPLGESNHVFVAGNRLVERWQEGNIQTFLIAEVGFGTGLNFLNSWYQWRLVHKPHSADRKLHYIGLEKFPVAPDDLARIYAHWPSLSQESDIFLHHYCSHIHSSGWHRLHLKEYLTLDLYLGDAREQLVARSLMDQKVDAWFLDGFSPRHNSALWSSHLLRLITAHSRPGTTLATYSAAGQVRRALETAGFKVRKTPGFGNKRHMLNAEMIPRDSAKVKSISAPIDSNSQPWFQYSPIRPQQNSAIVVGAGLAGAHCAAALARRHWQITVLERAAEPATGASAIEQLALRLRLYRQPNLEALFFLQAYLQAVVCYANLGGPDKSGWHHSGVLQLPDAINQTKRFDPQKLVDCYATAIVRLADKSNYNVQALNKDYAQTHCLWFPLGGWAESAKLCRRLLSHPNIKLLCEKQANTLLYQPDTECQWQVLGPNNEELATGSTVVLALGNQLQHFTQTQNLPLLLSPGQSTRIRRDPAIDSVDYVVCGERSLLPPMNKQRILSASYRQSTAGLELRCEDDKNNLAAYNRLFPALKKPKKISSQLAVRATTPDRLPLVGRLPDIQAMRGRFAALSKNAHHQFDEPGCYYEGLYVSAGHGSTGLCTTPLCAEFLASLITSDCLPLTQHSMNLLNPARFVIRDLKRQR